MNMIRVMGNYKANRLRLLGIPVILAVLLLGDKQIGEYMSIPLFRDGISARSKKIHGNNAMRYIKEGSKKWLSEI